MSYRQWISGQLICSCPESSHIYACETEQKVYLHRRNLLIKPLDYGSLQNQWSDDHTQEEAGVLIYQMITHKRRQVFWLTSDLK